MTGVTTTPDATTHACTECGDLFTRTSAELQYYDQRAASAPETCLACRVQFRAARNAELRAAHAEGARASLASAGSARPLDGRGRGGSRTGASSRGSDGEPRLFRAVCAECGRGTEVPFRPRSGRPVFCRDCYNARLGR